MRKGLSCIGLWLCLLLIIGCSNSDSQPENVEVYLEANIDRVLLKEEGGTAYINIASNTRWTILVENDEIPVIDLDVTPLAGDGDGTIKITYGREINKVQCEHATLIFYYYSEGKRVSKEVILTRQENDGNKDEEGWKTFTTFAKATNSFPATFKTMDGYKLIPTAISIFSTPGDVYYIAGQYKDSMFDIEKKEIHLELLSDPVCISGLSIGFESVDAYPSNAPFHSSNYNEVKPVLFDEHTIIIPMFFWVASTTDAIQEELKRHSFMLVYDSNGNSDSNLGLCLLHNVSDDEYRIRTLYTVQYCAFDIASAISRFESEKGNKPSRMTIEYKVNSLSDRLEDARIEKYTLDYKFQ